MKGFIKIDPKSIEENFMELLDEQTALLTAGSINKFNSMAANWGGFGVMWGKNVATIAVGRHQYTFEFLENHDTFTLAFFEEDYDSILQLYGNKSGREIDKMNSPEFTPVETEKKSVFFDEAILVIECKKLYADDFKRENFFDKPILDEFYAKNDFHRFYIAEIIGCYLKE